LLKELRETEKKDLLVVDSGDLLFKKFSAPIPENELKTVSEKARLIIESLNLMGYDALGVGDDDLTLGKDFLLEVSKKANFPFLSSNIVDEESGKLLFQSYLVKKTDGLKIGIFSLLSPDIFLSQSDIRKKGLTVRPPIEVAQNMIKELQPKTDLIVLLSHLGYAKDLELAQTLQGIHIIVGSHTGINLFNAPVVGDKIVLQTAPKGMYGGRLDLILYNNKPSFYNIMTKQSLENYLNSVKSRLVSPGIPEPEKAQLRKAKDGVEERLAQLQGKNEFTNTISPLREDIKEDSDIGKLIESFKSKFPEAVKH
jgi:2',3'-cyclic-nucleotide 2'-phosphodiesterase (5'-nucleotidase family)